MKSRTATQTDESSASGQHHVTSKERLDDWLDEALANTFPASDPIASPPSDAAPPERDRPVQNQSPAGATAPQRSLR